MSPPSAPKRITEQKSSTARATVVPLRPGEPGVYAPPSPVVRPILPHEIDGALRLFVSGSAAEATGELATDLERFKQTARLEGYDLTRQIVGLRGNRLRHAALFVARPGRTAFVFTSAPHQRHDPSDAAEMQLADEVLSRTCRWAFQDGCKLLQVIAQRADKPRLELCRRNGFKHLTDLIYMMRLHDTPMNDYAEPPQLAWLDYNTQNHDLFKKVILQTYRQSLDCPELEKMRDIEDVIASHKSSGRFEPRWWKILLRRGEPAGVLLLIPFKTDRALELTYMGLRPEARGLGLAKVLIRQALSCVDRYNAKYLMLGVDCRNKPARCLYEAFAFVPVLRRTILIMPAPVPVPQ